LRYLYADEKRSYEDYASGRVLYNMPGAAPFSVRLGDEVFQRCRAVLLKKGLQGPYYIYDPCCGGAYTLTVLGFLHNDKIKKIIASDIEPAMISLAERNLSLLSMDGLIQRINQIEHLIDKYNKDSHKDALESALRLKNIICMNKRDIETDYFLANAAELVTHKSKLNDIDMIITDIPYGRITSWSEMNSEDDCVSVLLESLHKIISSHTVIAIISDKKQKFAHDAYRRIEHFNAGKRRVTILELL